VAGQAPGFAARARTGLMAAGCLLDWRFCRAAAAARGAEPETGEVGRCGSSFGIELVLGIVMALFYRCTGAWPTDLGSTAPD